ncbi:GNAT family N-acetyltransferase [Paenibacillus frigoriresistens]|uniref:GNAT family N-acetyltransferase n=1 Tax=Paenibacillus alginolyticus TaxID=59839 RepID=UPI0015640E39|nr:GNAT family N-acetyltransferase [Paenibacillus frigoriresistens]NRF89834.1 GNAT family N-acetyltransferase [Paenibacillus frigoriresistens]
MIHVRLLEKQEYDFLMDMHYESIHILKGKPPKYELLNAPHIKKYSEDWGRKGDRAIIELIDNVPVGAAWYRVFDETNKGYGFIDCETPELGIAIHSNYRKQGLGLRLMKELIQQAMSDGYKGLSLSVDPDNESAVKLYKRLGFEYVGLSGTSWTMKLIIDDKLQ